MSSSSSSWWKTRLKSPVSTWMTPNTSPLSSTSGAHMIDRICRRATLSPPWKRGSCSASRESIARLERIARSITVRLMRCSDCRACVDLVRAGRKFPSASRSTIQPRSACGIIANRQSSVWAKIFSGEKHPPKLLVISSSALSLACAVAAARETSNRGRMSRLNSTSAGRSLSSSMNRRVVSSAFGEISPLSSSTSR